jgi:hypothetical protein
MDSDELKTRQFFKERLPRCQHPSLRSATWGPPSGRPARAGIASAETLRALGADAAYAKLLETGTHPHFIGYYVLVMGLQGRPWNDCKGAEKLALRARFDTLKARKYDKGRASLDAALDKIGVIKSGA